MYSGESESGRCIQIFRGMPTEKRCEGQPKMAGRGIQRGRKSGSLRATEEAVSWPSVLFCPPNTA